MKLEEFIAEHVMTDPEWKAAYEEADATREAARALLRARREAGLSQSELAARSGTAQAVISRIERGTVSPSLDTLSKIAKGLGMRPVVALQPMRRPVAERTMVKTAKRIPRPTEKKGAVPGKGWVPKFPLAAAMRNKPTEPKSPPKNSKKN
jgi:transcriptional regulator with XRE-family HTH domain